MNTFSPKSLACTNTIGFYLFIMVILNASQLKNLFVNSFATNNLGFLQLSSPHRLTFRYLVQILKRQWISKTSPREVLGFQLSLWLLNILEKCKQSKMPKRTRKMSHSIGFYFSRKKFLLYQKCFVWTLDQIILKKSRILKNDYQYKLLYINLTTRFIQNKKPIYVYDEVDFGDILK